MGEPTPQCLKTQPSNSHPIVSRFAPLYMSLTRLENGINFGEWECDSHIGQGPVVALDPTAALARVEGVVVA